MTTPPRRLAFCCELGADALFALCDRDDVRRALVRLSAEVNVGLVDLSDARARAVRQLNDDGIPTSAWLLLDRADGYWHHARAADATARRYDAFVGWTQANGLRWTGIDLDFEPAWAEMHALTSRRLGQLLSLVRARADAARWEPLLARIRGDGLDVATFVPPSVLDHRRRSARWLGLPDVRLERERVMLYSSLFSKSDGGFLASYAPACRAIAVGSTGGGIAFDGAGELRALTWDELARDLRIARAHADDLTVFSLEGCARQGFLGRLVDFDWTLRERPSTRSIDLARRLLGGG